LAWAAQAACVGVLTPGLLDGGCSDASDISVFNCAGSRSRSLDGTDGVPSFSDSPASVAPRSTVGRKRGALHREFPHATPRHRTYLPPLEVAPKQGPPR
jgi:hypothetical protein